MCGRYHMDEEMTEEIRRMVKILESRLNTGSRDIYPTMEAPVILKNGEEGLKADSMAWGFPGRDKKQLLINARAESALERKTFRDSIQHRRCIIPAKGFYEWDKSKEKFSYERKDAPVLFMAGCYNRYQGGERFVILTTGANPSVAPVHHRMPLILDPEELENWVLDDKATEYILHKTPVLLRSSTEYVQMRLF